MHTDRIKLITRNRPSNVNQIGLRLCEHLKANKRPIRSKERFDALDNLLLHPFDIDFDERSWQAFSISCDKVVGRLNPDRISIAELLLRKTKRLRGQNRSFCDAADRMLCRRFLQSARSLGSTQAEIVAVDVREPITQNVSL